MARAATCLTGDDGANGLDGGAGNDILTGKKKKKKKKNGNDVLNGATKKKKKKKKKRRRRRVRRGRWRRHDRGADGVAEDVDCGAGTDGGNADLEDRLIACEAVGGGRGCSSIPTTTASHWASTATTTTRGASRARRDPGNTTDEDCLGGPAPFTLTTATFSVFYETRGKRLKLTEWSLRTIPAGRAKVRITCTPPKGKKNRRACPFRRFARTFPRAQRRLNLLRRPLKRRLLRGGTVIRMQITHPLAIGRVRIVRTRTGKLPRDTKARLCLAPGARKTARCP